MLPFQEDVGTELWTNNEVSVRWSLKSFLHGRRDQRKLAQIGEFKFAVEKWKEFLRTVAEYYS